jgi:two-component system NtrC family sensor kinase
VLKLHHTLQKKIIFSFLIVVVVGGSVALALGIVLYGKTVLERAQQRVKMDINSAWMVYNQRIETLALLVQLTAKRDILIEALKQKNISPLQSLLEKVRIDNNLDFLVLTDARGLVVVRGRYPYNAGDDQSNDAMVAQSLGGKPISGTQILPQELLNKEGEGLAEQAFMLFVKTPRTAPRARDRETEGMVIKAAVPVFDNNDELLGVLYGGVLLNRNYEVVDRIKDIVYKSETYQGKEIGTATIFQWDLRISTNVKNSKGLRAIGTRVSEDVYRKVLENGEPFIGRAYVVNANYITAYEPIRDVNGTILGILYVGILEQPFIDVRNQVVLFFLGIALVGVVVALIIGYFLARSISKPIAKLAYATYEVSQGHFPATLDVTSDDEIGQLAQSFLYMSQSLKQTMSDLKELNKRYLGLLGFTTHELKQPLGVLKGYLIMLQDETLGKLSTTLQKEAILEMKSNVNTLNDMIQKYLQLTKIEAGKLVVEKRQINLFEEAIAPVLEGESSQLDIKNMKIEVERRDQLEKLTVTADPILMRIVFSNLITNAIKYGITGGIITLGFREKDEWYRFHVKNEGPGIPENKLTAVFEKFTRIDYKELGKQLGTGLGLYNTKEIIEKHGGTIWAESEEGKWANFIFEIPKGGTQQDS